MCIPLCHSPIVSFFCYSRLNHECQSVYICQTLDCSLLSFFVWSKKTRKLKQWAALGPVTRSTILALHFWWTLCLAGLFSRYCLSSWWFISSFLPWASSSLSSILHHDRFRNISFICHAPFKVGVLTGCIVVFSIIFSSLLLFR